MAFVMKTALIVHWAAPGGTFPTDGVDACKIRLPIRALHCRADGLPFTFPRAVLLLDAIEISHH